jgi:hypothetical protein
MKSLDARLSRLETKLLPRPVVIHNAKATLLKKLEDVSARLYPDGPPPSEDPAESAAFIAEFKAYARSLVKKQRDTYRYV